MMVDKKSIILDEQTDEQIADGLVDDKNGWTLDELINQMCPDGVEYRRLDKIAIANRGTRVVRADLEADGQYQVYQNSLKPLGQYDRYNRESNTCFVIVAGAAGEIGYSVDPFWAADDCFSLDCSDEMNSRFLYHVVLNQQDKLIAQVRRASIPRLPHEAIERLLVPVPPLDVQRRIAHILDLLSELTSELTSEREARQSQYEWYRNHLLDKDTLTGGEGGGWQSLADLIEAQCPDGVEYLRLEDITDRIKGMTGVSNKWAESGNCQFIDYLNAYNNIKIDVTKLPYATVKKLTQDTLQIGDILITSASETPEDCAHTGVIEDEIPQGVFLDDHLFGIRINAEYRNQISPSFLNYCLQAIEFRRQLPKAVRGVTRHYIALPVFMELKVPVPPLDVQLLIVDLLDKLDDYAVRIDGVLPREITASQQRYEWWRDRLLDFRDVRGGVERNWIWAIRQLLPVYLSKETETTQHLADILSYEQPSKYIVHSTDYRSDYKLPVLTPGQAFILGYTNETDGVFVASKQNPVIIFDDFTTSFHWVNFNFKVKSSAMKMLRAQDGLASTLRYAYHYMRTIAYTPSTHARQWISEYSQFRIPLPPLPIQHIVVSMLDRLDSYVNDLSSGLPAEIEARQKQYEWWRDRLLAFKGSDCK